MIKEKEKQIKVIHLKMEAHSALYETNFQRMINRSDADIWRYKWTHNLNQIERSWLNRAQGALVTSGQGSK